MTWLGKLATSAILFATTLFGFASGSSTIAQVTPPQPSHTASTTAKVSISTHASQTAPSSTANENIQPVAVQNYAPNMSNQGATQNIATSANSGLIVGFTYQETASSTSRFASIVLPLQVGYTASHAFTPTAWDMPYQVYLWNGSSYTFYQNLVPGVKLTFPNGGVDRFEVLGIVPSPELCSDGFIVETAFSPSGEADFMQTPITNNTPDNSSYCSLKNNSVLAFKLKVS